MPASGGQSQWMSTRGCGGALALPSAVVRVHRLVDVMSPLSGDITCTHGVGGGL